MLTEHEQLADHEARISRQELPPLQQPLDNIEEIRQALSHEWQPFETAPDVIKLFFHISKALRRKLRIPGVDIDGFWMAEKCQLSGLTGWLNHISWKHLPPPPKEKK